MPPTPTMADHGELTQWNDERGFGFITPEHGDAVFVHISAFRTNGNRPHLGDHVRYETSIGPDGRSLASRATIVGDVLPRDRVSVSSHTAMSIGALLAFAVLVFVTSLVDKMPQWAWIAYGITSVVAICAYWFDKRAAEAGRWRVPESFLWFWGLIGGWPGALVAQLAFRHKSAKASFQGVFWVSVLANIGLFLLVLHPFWTYTWSAD